MKKLFERNYKAVVNRGLINNRTRDLEFLFKLGEEFDETNEEVRYGDSIKKLNNEIADCLIVCSNWLIHRGVDLENILTKIAEKNEKRVKYQK